MVIQVPSGEMRSGVGSTGGDKDVWLPRLVETDLGLALPKNEAVGALREKLWYVRVADSLFRSGFEIRLEAAAAAMPDRAFIPVTMP